MAKDTTNLLLTAGGIVTALLIFGTFKGSRSTDRGDGLGSGSGTPSRTDAGLDVCNLDILRWTDKQHAKVRRAMLSEIARVGPTWSGPSELNEKAFQVARAMTIRFCPSWQAPEKRYQLSSAIDVNPPAFRTWWEWIEIGARRALGGWVT